ncbi:cytidylyltransferase domain-containing protein [Qipengyuania oceanensis]|uniref:Flagellar modification protein B n=1 Tax=Qipengyuania oceanensis TaxID=1463597 RepID=A0A844YJJ4_9SPHN|nr:acylneuraminate cytidylyltransferase family protein [Qipengyuania oceanensis]MXO63114.1 flagellar modification protein B [Qipengyuania oceanensis]
MTTVCTICARGGSVGVPGKNIRSLCGKPLIVYSIEQALAHARIDSVHVSTDSEEIARIAEQNGADVPFLRPTELATSTAAKVPAIIHLVEYLEQNGATVDTIVDLDPTSPLRSPEDISACLDMIEGGAASVITAYPADKNPYFNMVELAEDGTARLSKPPSEGVFVARQAAPEVYAMNASIYAWRRDALLPSVWDNRPALHVMPRERSIDVDSEIDFKLVELLICENGRVRN